MTLEEKEAHLLRVSANKYDLNFNLYNLIDMYTTSKKILTRSGLMNKSRTNLSKRFLDYSSMIYKKHLDQYKK